MEPKAERGEAVVARAGGKGPRSPAGAAGPALQAQVMQAMQGAVAAHRQGRLAEAIQGYRRALRLAPEFPPALNNMGVALKAAGQLDEAVSAYRRAVKADPVYASAHANLAAALALTGHNQESLGHALQAMRHDPSNAGYRRGVADALRDIRFSQASPAVAEALLVCFADSGIEHQLLAPAAVSLLKLDAAVSRALALADGVDDRALLEAAAGLSGHALLQALLRQAVVADAEFERLLTRLRRVYLRAVTGDGPAMPQGQEGLLAALACQCLLVDFVYEETPEETVAVAGLAAAARERARLDDGLLVLAMYRPLSELEGAEALRQSLAGVAPPADVLVRRHLVEPLREAEIARDLPSLTPIEGEVTAAMRAQYETHPYPRWLSCRRKEPKPLGSVLRELFPHLKEQTQVAGKTNVLVAGCGTGKHAVDVATRFADCKVLAVDLSRRSLAFAARRAAELEIANVSFAQADLLALGALERRFHLIESVGVLHHLAEPIEGWRVLTGLLEPGGLMRIGLYSRTGRRHVAAARAFISERGFADDPEGLRAARRAIRELEAEDPVRRVVGELDFYSLSGCHDLLFNVQETSFSLPEVAAALAELGLAFLGFETAEPALKRRYAERFPQDPAMTDLAAWAELEETEPDSFRQMYQFWCRKA